MRLQRGCSSKPCLPLQWGGGASEARVLRNFPFAKSRGTKIWQNFNRPSFERPCNGLATGSVKLPRAPSTEFLPNSALNIQPPHHGQMIFEILLTFGFIHRLDTVTRSLQLGNQPILTAQIDGIQADKCLALSQIRLQPPHPGPVAVTIDLVV